MKIKFHGSPFVWARVIIVVMALVCFGCNSSIPPAPQTDFPFYNMIVNGHEGTLVFPEQDIFHFHAEAKDDLEKFTMTSCHRDLFKENSWNVQQVVATGIFGWGKRTIDKKREVEFDYKPTYIEADGDCVVILQGFNISGKNSYFIADFANRKYQLPAYLQCNGYTYRDGLGSSICQAKVGNYQAISFDEVVTVSDKNKCGITGGKKNIDFIPNGGFCTVIFKGTSGNKHKLTIYGYTRT